MRVVVREIEAVYLAHAKASAVSLRVSCLDLLVCWEAVAERTGILDELGHSPAAIELFQNLDDGLTLGLRLREAHRSGSEVGSTFLIGGWALNGAASEGTGAEAVDVWAYPRAGSGAGAIYLGSATYGGSRPDVGAVFGAQFTGSGYNLVVSALSPGTYDIVVYARSTVTGRFDNSRVITVSVR